MIDIRLIRTNPELVKENIKKKFQDEKLVLVDEVLELDGQLRAAATEADSLRNQRNVSSKQIGAADGPGEKGRSGGGQAAGGQHWTQAGGTRGQGNTAAGRDPQTDAGHSQYY